MRTAIRQAAALMLLALVPALLAAFFHPKKPAWRSDEITLSVAQSWPAKVLWLDARPISEYNRAHIPGALPLNEDAWNDLLPAVFDAWEPETLVVVYCSSASCQTSRDVARRLHEANGMAQIFVLQGGWESWQRAQK